MCAGQMLVVPAQVLAVARWGWRPVLVGLSALAAVLAVAAIFGTGSEGRTARASAGREGAGGVRALVRDPLFWVFLAPYAVCGFTDSGLVDNHLVPYARGLGASDVSLAGALSALAVANLAGTVAAGYLADRWGRGTVLAALYALRAAALGLLLGGGVGALWAFAPLFGATHFATIAPTNTLALTLLSGSAPGLAVGLASFVHQLGAAAGALAGGVAFDRFGSYEPAFGLAAGMLAASAAVAGWIQGVARGGPRRSGWAAQETQG